MPTMSGITSHLRSFIVLSGMASSFIRARPTFVFRLVRFGLMGKFFVFLVFGFRVPVVI